MLPIEAEMSTARVFSSEGVLRALLIRCSSTWVALVDGRVFVSIRLALPATADGMYVCTAPSSTRRRPASLEAAAEGLLLGLMSFPAHITTYTAVKYEDALAMSGDNRAALPSSSNCFIARAQSDRPAFV